MSLNECRLQHKQIKNVLFKMIYAERKVIIIQNYFKLQPSLVVFVPLLNNVFVTGTVRTFHIPKPNLKKVG